MNDDNKQFNKGFCVGFLPWWPENPYQRMLREEFRKAGVRVIGNPPLSLLRLLINRDGLDIVHVHWAEGLYKNCMGFLHIVLILLLYRILKDNVVWTVHNLDFRHTNNVSVRDRAMRLLLMKISKVLFVHSQSSEREIKKRFDYRGKIVLTRHPSYIGCYPNVIKRADSRKKTALNDKQTVYLFFGYVKPYKGLEELINVFKNVADPQSVLLLAGKPINNEIKERVLYLSSDDSRIKTDLKYIPDEDIQVYFSASDVVVFPFREIHTSGSIMLALSFGKPVIAPLLASIPEYVDESVGILFNADDPEGLKSALIKAQNCNLKEMGQAALNRAKSLSWTDMAQKCLEGYRMI